ncbi:MAG: response regulator [Verrucomicrobia bacterium]|jgi:DNA-binding NtrC family response regulator|nr:response regulator [Verrucomicrobiota bacterium]MBT7068966.1 response regulator [Verrucomicrobiota bacterium]MBT7702035.1 response regulator [Verrucomicrobiota bacterium]
MRILVIDDDVTMLWSLSNTLRRWGSEVEVATGARSGIRMVANRPFDVILLDYRMPDHDAVWFLRNAVIPQETPIILMTGFADPRGLSELRSLGVCDVLEKPFSQSELHDQLEKLSVGTTWRQRKREMNRKETETQEKVHAAHADDTNGRPYPCGTAAPHAA